MLICHRVLCSLVIEHYATRTEGLQALLLSVSLVGRPRLVDAVPEVVDALAPDDLDEEGKEGADEHLLDDQLLGDTRLVDAHADNGLAHLSRRRAGGEDGDVATQLLPVADIDGQARLVDCRPRTGRHLPAGCVGGAGEMEMLLGLRSYGQDLVVAAVDVDVNDRTLLFFHHFTVLQAFFQPLFNHSSTVVQRSSTDLFSPIGLRIFALSSGETTRDELKDKAEARPIPGGPTQDRCPDGKGNGLTFKFFSL